MSEIAISPVSTPTSTQINEFQRIYRNGMKEIPRFFDKFTEDYPLIATICMVAFAILGFMNVFSFSITAIVSGLVLAGLSVALGKNIFSDPGAFWQRLKPSLGALFTCGASASSAGSEKVPPKSTPV